jgi:hypothetical protein
MQNKVFFPQLLLDQWGIEGKIDLTATELIVLAEGRRYKISEAVHIIAEVSGANDEQKLVGKVKANALLNELGAEIFENSMILGENAYDITPGWMGIPSSSFADHLLSSERMKARGGRTDIGAGPQTDEEMLRRFMEGTL